MGKAITFGQLDDLSRAFAACLRATGLASGDRVAVMMPNVPQYPVAHLGLDPQPPPRGRAREAGHD